MPPCEYIVFDEDVIRSDELHKDEKDRIRHIINMFLEIFGMCEIVDTDHIPISAGNVRTVEWTILPPGKYPWEVAKQHLAEYFNNVLDGKTQGGSNAMKLIKDAKKVLAVPDPIWMCSPPLCVRSFKFGMRS